MDKKTFIDPPKEYRPSPFWSWNDRLDPDELRWQIREMKEKGFGGFFMHSRVGLVTPYLSDEWMECIRAGIEEARSLDMEAWLYDEDKWPSGYAGGLLTEKSEQYASKHIMARLAEREEALAVFDDENLIAIYRMTFSKADPISDGGSLLKDVLLTDFILCKSREDIERSIYEYDKKQMPAETAQASAHAANAGKYLICSMFTSPKTNRFNGQNPPNRLNRKATEEFIRLTHQAYADRFAEFFGPNCPGIFTDEPDLNHLFSGRVAGPWTPGLPEYFESITGYSIYDIIPLLYFNGKGSRKARYDYWRVITRRFVEHYTIPIAEWCDKYGIALTGHYQCEDWLIDQLLNIGAAMPHYKHMQLPGIDHLGRNIDCPLTLKQVSSVAHQFGKKRVLCEIFGVSGHSMSFEEQKWIADFHFALGITFINQHLTLYSMPGDRKRDYPPTISYHQPYWEDYKHLNDYFARASYMLSQGEFVSDILLLHPIASAWSLKGLGLVDMDNPALRDEEMEIRRYDRELQAVITTLLESHNDFDLGDESILEEHGRSTDSGIRVERSLYKVIIVPPGSNWSRSTFNLIKEHLERGFKTVFVGGLPGCIDGEPTDEWLKLSGNKNVIIAKAAPDLPDILANCIGSEKDVTITDAVGREIGDIYYHHRFHEGEHILFLCNRSRTATYEAFVSLRDVGDAGVLREWDLLTGEVKEIGDTGISKEGKDDNGGNLAGGRLQFKTTLPPAGSRLFTISIGISISAETSAGAETSIDTEESSDASVLNFSVLKLNNTSHAAEDNEANENNGTNDVNNVKKKCRDIVKKLLGPWEYLPKHLNSLTLDYCRYSLDSEDEVGPVPVFKAREHIHNASELARYDGLQPWCIERLGVKLKPVSFSLSFDFDIALVPDSLFLVVEKPGKLSIAVNRIPVQAKSGDWHWDKQFGKIDIRNVAKTGPNNIRISGDFDMDVEIEDIYLVGDFGVWKSGYNSFIIGEKPRDLYAGSWVSQGYPFYAGSMVYRKRVELRLDELKGILASRAKDTEDKADCAERGHSEERGRILLRLNSPKGTLFKARVNGKEAGTLICRPWEFDMTDMVVEGANDIEIEVVSSLRNTFGPLHHPAHDSLDWTSPSSFTDKEGWTDSYRLVDWGLLEPPEIVISL